MLAPAWTSVLPIRATLVCALASALAVLLGACGAEPNEASAGGSGATPSIVAVEPKLELDTVTFGEATESSFELVNQSDEIARIVRIGPGGCSCTTLFLRLSDDANTPREEMTGSPIDLEVQPGQRFWIDVRFDSSRMRRPVSRRVDAFAVSAEGKPGLLLEYGIDVWTPFWIEPWSKDLGRVGAREKASGFFSVKHHDALKFEPVFPEYVDGWRFVATKLSGTAEDSYSIDFFAPDELPYGPFSVRLPVSADVPNSPTVKVLIRGVAVEDFAWGPEKIVIRPDARGQAEATAWLAVRGQVLQLELQGVVLQGIPREILSAQAHTLNPGRDYSVQLNLQSVPSEEINGNLVLTTNAPDAPVVRIPVTVLPAPQ